MEEKIYKYIANNIEEILISIAIAIMSCSVFLQILCRYILTEPLVFTEELSRYSYIWIASLSIALAAKKRSHLAINIFVKKMFSERSRVLLEILISMIAIVILIVFIPQSIKYCIFVRPLISPALRFSKLVIAISLPIGYALAVIRFIVVLVEDIKKYKMLKISKS